MKNIPICNLFYHVALDITRPLPKTISGNDAPPSSLMDSTVNPKVKTSERKGVKPRSLARSTSGVEGACWSSEIKLRRLTSNSITHTGLHKPNNKLVSV
jgi:hypothetical protein